MTIKLDAIRLEDLTDVDWEALAERMYNDQELMSDFIEKHYEDFEGSMYQQGVSKDYYCDHEMSYCEDNDDDLIEFAFQKYYKDTK